MRRASFFVAAVALLGAVSSAAADEASLLATAKALLAKILPKSAVKRIEDGKDDDKAKAGDWSFEIAFDDPGILRAASTRERGKGGLLLSVAARAQTICGADQAKKPWLTLGSDDRLPLRGSVEKGRYSEAWVSFAEGGAAFAGKPTKLKLSFSENDGALYLPVEAAFFAHHDAVAFCAADGKPDARCLTFSLKGFGRAYDFVCQAK